MDLWISMDGRDKSAAFLPSHALVVAVAEMSALVAASLVAASSACAALLVAPPQLITRPRMPAAAAARRIPTAVRASAAALPPPGADTDHALYAAGRASGRALEPMLVVLRWLRSRLLALLGWLRLGRRAPMMVGAVLPVGCVVLEMQLVLGLGVRVGVGVWIGL